MSRFVNTNFVFSCYFSVLFLPRMSAISFYLASTPSYLFIYHHSHIIQHHVNLRLQLLLTHVCPVTEFAVASHLNTANSCCHHVFLRHFRFQKCLPANSTRTVPELHFFPVIFLANLPIFQYNHDIGAFWHLLLYMQAIFSHLTGSCDSHVQFFR